MTLSELDDTLPNGLHDAYLTGLSVFYDQGTASLKVKLLVSGSGEKARHKDAEIRLAGLVALVVEGPEQALRSSGPLGISSFETSEQHYPGLSRFSQEVKGLFHSLYVEDPWNSFIHIAAASADVIWDSQLADTAC